MSWLWHSYGMVLSCFCQYEFLRDVRFWEFEDGGVPVGTVNKLKV